MPPLSRNRVRRKTPEGEEQPLPRTNLTLHDIATVRPAKVKLRNKHRDTPAKILAPFDREAAGLTDKANASGTTSADVSVAGGARLDIASEMGGGDDDYDTHSEIWTGSQWQSRPQSVYHGESPTRSMSMSSSSMAPQSREPHAHVHTPQEEEQLKSQPPTPLLQTLSVEVTVQKQTEQPPLPSMSLPESTHTTSASQTQLLGGAIARARAQPQHIPLPLQELLNTPARLNDATILQGGESSAHLADDGPTPTQATFDIQSATQRNRVREYEGVGYSVVRRAHNRSYSSSVDSQEERREREAMAGISAAFSGASKPSGTASSKGNGFDELNWDPDIESDVAETESPEPVAVPPKQLTYTTVGSVVNPDAITQIAAPNRIQRDNTNRRPFMAAPQDRRQHGYYPAQGGPMPSLNNTNSMQYAQQYSQNPRPQHYNTPPSISSRSSRAGAVRPTVTEMLGQLPNTGHQRAPMIHQSNSFDQETQMERVQGLSRMHSSERAFTQDQQSHYSQGQYPSNQHPGWGDDSMITRIIKPKRPAHDDHQLQQSREQERGLQLHEPGTESSMAERAVMTAVEDKNMRERLGSVLSSSTHSASTIIRHGQDNVHYSGSEVMDESVSGRTSSTQGQIQVLRRMQTIQQLAKFDNPMQKLAKEKLRELSINNLALELEPSSSIVSKAPLTPFSFEEYQIQEVNECLGALKSGSGPLDQYSSIPQPANGEHDHGTLDRQYQFPQIGGPRGPGTQSNPLFRPSDQGSSLPPGVPQPLTAGPPGHRPPPVSSRPGRSLTNEAPEQSSGYGYAHYPPHSAGTFTDPGANPDSPWHQQYMQLITTGQVNGPRAPPERLVTHDTLTWEEALKYYPYGGLPKDFNFNFKFAKVDMSQLGQEDKDAAKAKARDDRYYSGQRLLGMTMDEHVTALESKKSRATSLYGPIAPPVPKESIKKLTPYTQEDINKMDESEAAAPALSMLFGTLLNYSKDNTRQGPTKLSKLGKSPASHIDNCETGNKSLYGEDWGVSSTSPKGSMTSYEDVF